ncbi:M20 aminoacylase family protein [Vogesella sp. LIG4]|uniref:M20 aminoacylase family protein n=1 Tax=Vogesella sp. LIG4 TaxID=1192162 RepID=UPI0008201221|nr:M20 aminoacylase family protein [Vogesella sp. LIG4]SCK29726.1 hippurate hydrolase [Vogesella sp. LIG4]
MHDVVMPGMRAIEDEMIAVRRTIHAHPELSFEEVATSGLVAERLERWGYQVTRGLGVTGLVGTLKKGSGSTAIGIRADMDALPIHEDTGLPYASSLPGKMHACGHDGHTAMLLAAAHYLASDSCQFDGTVHLIFQPAEEGGGGAFRMLQDGLFERFPCDAVFAMHNMPGYPTGKLGFLPGPFMASADGVKITITGYGGHGAMPHKTVDPVVVAASLVMALQTIVARNVPPLETAVVTVGAIHSGEASNVIPDSAELQLCIRAMTHEVRSLLLERIEALAHGQASSYGARAEIELFDPYPPLINSEQETAFARQVAVDWLGEGGLIQNLVPVTGSEDFAFMLEQRPGCYLLIGNGDGEGGCMVHNPGFDFNDDSLAIGASYWVKLVEAFLR